MGLCRWAAADSPVLHCQAGRLCRWHAASGSQEWLYAGWTCYGTAPRGDLVLQSPHLPMSALGCKCNSLTFTAAAQGCHQCGSGLPLQAAAALVLLMPSRAGGLLVLVLLRLPHTGKDALV